MKVIVFGASGRVGSKAVIYALQEGHEVTAFVRRPVEFSVGSVRPSAGPGPCAGGSGLSVVLGDVLDRDGVRDAVAGHDVVFSTLSVRGFDSTAGSAVKAGRKPATMADAVRNIILAMESHRIGRIVTVAVSGILPDPSTGGLMRDRSDYPAVFLGSSAVHLQVHLMLEASELEWTIVCPGRMPDGERTGRYLVAAESIPEVPRRLIAPGERQEGILTGDVADFMIKQIVSRDFLRNRVGIAPARP